MKRILAWILIISFIVLPAKAFSGISFDGVDDVVSTSFNVSNYTTGSISWWQKNNFAYNDNESHKIWNQIQGGVGEFVFWKFGNNYIFIGWYTPAGGDDRVVLPASASNSPQNIWIHYVFTWADTGTSYFYANGSLLGSQPNCSVVATAASFILYQNGTGGGQLNEFALWNVVLTQAQIDLLANSRIKGMPLQIQPANLKLYLPMDSGMAGASADLDTAWDMSGNGNNGNPDNGANDTGMNWAPETILSYPAQIIE